jgi:hypothetical protein
MRLMTEAEDLARCDAEIAACKAKLRAGHKDVDGLMLAIADWAAEKRLIEEAIRLRESAQ